MGNARPAQLVPKIHSDIGRTVELVLWMYDPFFSIGKTVVTNSGFCGENGIVALMAKGVYACALIKKRWY